MFDYFCRSNKRVLFYAGCRIGMKERIVKRDFIPYLLQHTRKQGSRTGAEIQSGGSRGNMFLYGIGNGLEKISIARINQIVLVTKVFRVL